MTRNGKSVNEKFPTRFKGKFTGVRAVARLLGCSAGHVSQVWAGKRQSERVLALKPKTTKQEEQK